MPSNSGVAKRSHVRNDTRIQRRLVEPRHEFAGVQSSRHALPPVNAAIAGIQRQPASCGLHSDWSVRRGNGTATVPAEPPAQPPQSAVTIHATCCITTPRISQIQLPSADSPYTSVRQGRTQDPGACEVEDGRDSRMPRRAGGIAELRYRVSRRMCTGGPGLSSARLNPSGADSKLLDGWPS